MRNLLIYAGVSIFALGVGGAYATTYGCSTNTKPSCAAMGYNRTADDCKGYYMLRCPWDKTRVYCDCPYELEKGKSSADESSDSCKKYGKIYYKDSCEKKGDDLSQCYQASEVTCIDTRGVQYGTCSDVIECRAGSILYQDMQCRNGFTSTTSLAPIGIVFDPEHKLAVALTENSGDSNSATANHGSCNYCGLNKFYTQVYHGYNNYTTEYSTASFVMYTYLPSYSYRSFDPITHTWVMNDANLRDCLAGVTFHKDCEHPNYSNYMMSTYSFVPFSYGTEAATYVTTTTDKTGNVGGYAATYKLLQNETAADWPAANYCATYSTPGAAAGNWALPAPGDLLKLREVASTVNFKLFMLQFKNVQTRQIATTASQEFKQSLGRFMTYVPKYWTAYLYENAFRFPWTNQTYIKNGPIVVDMRYGYSQIESSNAPGVRARCILKYAD